MSVARFAFQACSFNHSDISPFRINDLRAASSRLSHNGFELIVFAHVVWIHRVTNDDRKIVAGIVSDLLISTDHLRASEKRRASISADSAAGC